MAISGRVSYITASLSCLFILSACSSMKAYTPLPAQLENEVTIPGFHDIRAWGDTRSTALAKSASLSIQQERASNHGRLLTHADSIALSGGGQDGAFGAGLVCGWTKSGKRPHFKLVTGISTGALMAPFVFLGPAYDPQLRKAYTTISDDDIYKRYSLFSIFLSVANIRPLPSLADDHPLEAFIATLIDEKLLKAVAREHLKGRRLLIGTSQMNAERLVIWDMGAIANSGSPNALALFRKVLLASASLPATFPPQYFQVEAGGHQYDEMHSDGGVEVQVMLFSNAIIPFSQQSKELQGAKRVKTLYIVRNTKIQPEWKNVKPTLTYIALRSISSLIKSQGIGDLFRLYTYAKRDNFDYNLAYIPANFTDLPKSEFDKDYMNKLFKLGYDIGKNGGDWKKHPPEYTP